MKNKEVKYDLKISSKDVYKDKCPIIYALEIVGQKWKLPIMWHLFDQEVTRYNELKRSINGITNIMLTKSLRELEEHKLIKRVEYDTKPPKVEYSLTDRGKALLPALNELYVWGEEQYKIDKK